MKRITLLTKHDCSLCDDSYAVLELLHKDFDFELETAELTSERGLRLAIEAGLLFPPITLVDGKPFCHGRLSEQAMRRELGSAEAAMQDSSSPDDSATTRRRRRLPRLGWRRHRTSAGRP